MLSNFFLIVNMGIKWMFSPVYIYTAFSALNDFVTDY